MIRTVDNAGLVSPLSNVSSAPATGIATSQGGDGEGAANFAPAEIPRGTLVQTTMTFTVGASSITAGGAIAMRVPFSWTQPTTEFYADSETGLGWGHVSYSTGTGVDAVLTHEPT